MANYRDIRYNFGSTAEIHTDFGNMILLEKIIASGDETISFTDKIDSSYKEYIFSFINIHPETDSAAATLGLRDGGTDYDATKLTTAYYSWHNEGDDNTGLSYNVGHDIVGTGFAKMGGDALGNDADQSFSGYMHLFNPSSTTFIKNFFIPTNTLTEADYCVTEFTAGYANVTAAIDGIQFKMSTGDIDYGIFKLYGVN